MHLLCETSKEGQLPKASPGKLRSLELRALCEVPTTMPLSFLKTPRIANHDIVYLSRSFLQFPCLGTALLAMRLEDFSSCMHRYGIHTDKEPSEKLMVLAELRMNNVIGATATTTTPSP